MSSEIQKAYKYCEKVTRHYAKSFYFAAKFLPKDKQPAVYALYALCRHLDNEVDDAEVKDSVAAIKAVEIWKSKLISNAKAQSDMDAKKIDDKTNPKFKIQNSKSMDLVLLAWTDTLTKYNIPKKLPLELMEGVLMDTHIKRYETFDELYVYCYRVASTVGLMSSEILGYSKPEALDYAEALGIAMQLTNILRDIREDSEMGRIYLPQEDLRRFKVTEQQIFEQRLDENFVNLMKFETKRARQFYQKAELGIPMLEKNSRFGVLLASRIYSRILDEIERQNYDIFTNRAHTTTRQKMLSIPQIWFEARSL